MRRCFFYKSDREVAKTQAIKETQRSGKPQMEELDMEEIKNTETQETVVETREEQQQEQTLSVEEQLAQLRLENAKLKKAFDKSASETASYKKQLREKQSADEIAMQEKAEREAAKDERISMLERENTINKFVKSFMGLGYSEDMAEKAASAQYDNDTEILFKIQNEFLAKQQASIKAELMKSMPKPISGAGEEQPSATYEEFQRMGYQQIVEFKNRYPETYKAYMARK